MEDAPKDQHNAHIATIAAAYLGNPSNPVSRDEIADVIRQIGLALKASPGTEPAAASEVEKPSPAAIRKSITDDYLISFIDNKHYKTLARHLTTHNHTPQSYRERYGLKSDYPMTAPSYSAMRSSMAKTLGLGQQRRQAAKQAVLPEPKADGLVGDGEPVVAEAPETGRPAKTKNRSTDAKSTSAAPEAQAPERATNEKVAPLEPAGVEPVDTASAAASKTSKARAVKGQASQPAPLAAKAARKTRAPKA